MQANTHNNNKPRQRPLGGFSIKTIPSIYFHEIDLCLHLNYRPACAYIYGWVFHNLKFKQTLANTYARTSTPTKNRVLHLHDDGHFAAQKLIKKYPPHRHTFKPLKCDSMLTVVFDIPKCLTVWIYMSLRIDWWKTMYIYMCGKQICRGNRARSRRSRPKTRPRCRTCCRWL